MAPIIIVFAYTIITIICVGLSALSTYQGYFTEIGQSAIFIATVVTVGLFASDMIILERRSKGNPITGAVIVLAIFTIASVMANFHFIYTKLMGTSLAEKRYETAAYVFKNNVAAAEGYVQLEDKLPALTSQINQEFKTLRDEVRDPTKPGFGANAKKRWVTLQELTSQIKVSIQWPAPPAEGAAPKDVDPILKEAGVRLTDVFEKANANNVWKAAADATARAKALKIEPGEGRPPSALTPDDYLQAVRAMFDETQALERVLKRTADQAGIAKLILTQPVGTEGAQLVKMDDTRRTAFEPANIGKAALAGIGAVLLDFMPFVFAILLIHPPKSDVVGQTGRGPIFPTVKLKKRPSILNRPTRTGPV